MVRLAAFLISRDKNNSNAKGAVVESSVMPGHKVPCKRNGIKLCKRGGGIAMIAKMRASVDNFPWPPC